jgi:SlyX protein
MHDTELAERIERLEIRLAHQEAAVEELTRILLVQERLLKQQQDALGRLDSLLRTLAPANIAPADADSPPPHY